MIKNNNKNMLKNLQNFAEFIAEIIILQNLL
jgi:hypothetical protein